MAKQRYNIGWFVKPIGMEEWSPVKGFEGLYKISTHGRLRSIGRYVPSKLNNVSQVYRNSKIIKPSVNRYGYLQVCLWKEKNKFNKTIHQLVALNYMPNPYNYPDVNHEDTNKFNNQPYNLEWCTSTMNNEHAVKNRLFPSGEKSHVTKLTLLQVSEIRKLHTEGLSSRKIAERYPTTKTTVLNIIKGYTWKYE